LRIGCRSLIYGGVVSGWNAYRESFAEPKKPWTDQQQRSRTKPHRSLVIHGRTKQHKSQTTSDRLTEQVGAVELTPCVVTVLLNQENLSRSSGVELPCTSRNRNNPDEAN